MNSNLHEKYDLKTLFGELARRFNQSGTHTAVGEYVASDRALVYGIDDHVTYFVCMVGTKYMGRYMMNLEIIIHLIGDDAAFIDAMNGMKMDLPSFERKAAA